MGKTYIKFTYEEVKTFVNGLGYELISEEYLGIFCKLILKDVEGYFYKSVFNDLKSGRIPFRFSKSNPYTIQNIKLWLKLNKIDFNLHTEKYVGTKQKIILSDKEGYFYSPTFNSLIKTKNPERFHTSNSFVIQNINLWCKLNNKSFELVSKKYFGSLKYIKCKCLNEKCQEEFSITWASISQGGGCVYCCTNPKKVSKSNCLATKSPQLASEWHPIKNGDLTSKNVTVSSNKNVWWQCINNHEWKTPINNRTIGSGCPYCAGKLPTENNNLLVVNPKLCKEWDYNKNEKSPKEYTPVSGKHVWWKCKDCKNEWKAKISNRVINGNGCPECSESKGEIRIRDWMRLYNIIYLSHKEFYELIGLGGGNLSYDFYLPKYNLLIEYQGIQHEKYRKGFHKSKKDFEKQQAHDRRKKEYALLNGYKFLEIWYWDFDNIEEILEREINKRMS